MSVRRLHHEQPSGFVFSRDNAAWAKKTIAKYPKGRQASAVIPLLWRGQEQEGWVSEPMIRTIADMLSMPYIRVLEVATFYTMFQLQPVGKKAHIQVCGTTPCMLRGAEDLKAVCQRKIHHDPHHLSADGDFSWEEVECLGACVNAPMIQIVKDTYEDLTPETLEKLIDDLAAGNPVTPGPQNGRQYSAPVGGPTTLLEKVKPAKAPRAKAAATPKKAPVKVVATGKPSARQEPADAEKGKPTGLVEARGGKADDLKLISGVGPKIEGILNELGIFHFDQVAGWRKAEREWVDNYLKFKGRIEREDWVSQAKTLAKGGETEFSKRASKAPAKPRGKGK
ncbi:MAG: NADH-quinone oxidoreductase subunit NuoE [Rhodobiaceae bacterium]|nr:NADH-quinone oxidoreductase subunit NuoE [Rhodobiaceae bacterium]